MHSKSRQSLLIPPLQKGNYKRKATEKEECQASWMKRVCSPLRPLHSSACRFGKISVHPSTLWLLCGWHLQLGRAFRLDVSQGVTSEMMHKWRCSTKICVRGWTISPYRTELLQIFHSWNQSFLPSPDETFEVYWVICLGICTAGVSFTKLPALLWMCHLPLSQLAVSPPPSVSSLSPVPCSPRGHGHGNASHHSVEQGRVSGLGQKRKIPGCVSVTPWLPSADAAGPVPDQLPHRALKQDRHMCNKMWKQRKFGNRGYRRGMARKASQESGTEVDSWRTWVSLEEMQWVLAVTTALSTWNCWNWLAVGKSGAVLGAKPSSPACLGMESTFQTLYEPESSTGNYAQLFRDPEARALCVVVNWFHPSQWGVQAEG